MNIKKLDFIVNPNGARVWTSFGDYCISEFKGKYYILFFNEWEICDENHKDSFDTLEEAMNVTQVDFEKRVKQCIE